MQSSALQGMRLLTKLTKLRFVPALYAKHSFLQGFTDYRFVPALYAKQSKAERNAPEVRMHLRCVQSSAL